MGVGHHPVGLRDLCASQLNAGTYPKLTFCPWGPGGCPMYSGWVLAWLLKKHMVEIHGGRAPPRWTPGPMRKPAKHPMKYVVKGPGGQNRAENVNVEVHRPAKNHENLMRGTYNPARSCPWKCCTIQSQELLTWSKPSRLASHVDSVHDGLTPTWFNYPNIPRPDARRLKLVRQMVRQSRAGNGRPSATTRGQKRKPTSGSPSQPPPITRGQNQDSLAQIMSGSASPPHPPSFFINIPRKRRTPREHVDRPNQPVEQPPPNIASSNQPHKKPRPPLDLNEAPTWSGFTDPGSPGGASGIESGSSASSHWPS